MLLPYYEYKNNIPALTVGNGIGFFPRHLHIQVEILYVEEGEMQVGIDEKNYTVRAGDVCVIFPNVIHSYDMSPHISVRHRMAICDPDVLGEQSNLLMNYLPVCPVLHKGEYPDALPTLLCLSCTALPEEGPSEAPEDVRIAQLYVRLMMALCLPCMQLEPVGANLPQNMTARVITYLSQHYQEKLSLESIAKQFGVSRYQLSRMFTHTIHVGFYPYVNFLRVEHAKQRLSESDANVLEIALESGFENQQTFNRVFRSQCGCTPREYRYTHGHNKKEK